LPLFVVAVADVEDSLSCCRGTGGLTPGKFLRLHASFAKLIWDRQKACPSTQRCFVIRRVKSRSKARVIAFCMPEISWL
jgi:hypothetical protein